MNKCKICNKKTKLFKICVKTYNCNEIIKRKEIFYSCTNCKLYITKQEDNNFIILYKTFWICINEDFIYVYDYNVSYNDTEIIVNEDPISSNKIDNNFKSKNKIINYVIKYVDNIIFI